MMIQYNLLRWSCFTATILPGQKIDTRDWNITYHPAEVEKLAEQNEWDALLSVL